MIKTLPFIALACSLVVGCAAPASPDQAPISGQPAIAAVTAARDIYNMDAPAGG